MNGRYRLRPIISKVTPEFNDLVLKMIQKRPADRFSSLHEFISRFRSVRIFQDDEDPLAGRDNRMY